MDTGKTKATKIQDTPQCPKAKHRGHLSVLGTSDPGHSLPAQSGTLSLREELEVAQIKKSPEPRDPVSHAINSGPSRPSLMPGDTAACHLKTQANGLCTPGDNDHPRPAGLAWLL